MRSVHGQSEREQKPHKLRVSSSMPYFSPFILALHNLVALTSKINSFAVKSWVMRISKNMGVKLRSRLLGSFDNKANLMKVRISREVIMLTCIHYFSVVDGDIAYWKAGG